MAGQDTTPSEFSGYPGTLQPLPHELNAAEQAMVERSIEPDDAETTIDEKRLSYQVIAEAPVEFNG